MECLLVLAAIFTANIVKAIMRDILSLSLGITSEILMVSRQKDPSLPPTGTDGPVTSSLSLSLCTKETIFSSLMRFLIFTSGRAGPGPFNPLRPGNVLMAHQPQVATVLVVPGETTRHSIRSL